jgi:hypothetical protein
MWLFALHHMVCSHNAMVQHGKETGPNHIFMGHDPPWMFADFQVFGYPSYAFQKCLQDGNAYRKWKACIHVLC